MTETEYVKNMMLYNQPGSKKIYMTWLHICKNKKKNIYKDLECEIEKVDIVIVIFEGIGNRSRSCNQPSNMAYRVIMHTLIIYIVN